MDIFFRQGKKLNKFFEANFSLQCGSFLSFFLKHVQYGRKRLTYINEVKNSVDFGAKITDDPVV